MTTERQTVSGIFDSMDGFVNVELYTEDEIRANRKLVAEALRSGKYDQTTGQLAYTEDQQAEDEDSDILTKAVGYCCLGVACEVAIQEGVIDGFNPTNGYAPAQVAAWIGIGLSEAGGMTGILKPEQRPYHGSADYAIKVGLVDLNDTYELTFPEIAEIFEGEQLLINEDVVAV